MLLLVVATMGVFGAIGFGVLAYRVPTILKEERQLAREQAVGLARYFQELIAGLEGRLGTLSALKPDLPPAQVQALLDAAVAEGGFAAIFLLDDQGRVAQAALANGSSHVRPNLLGADFSRNPLFASARHLGRRVWSDRYLSALNGEGAVGLAIPIKDYVLLGEVAPDFARAAVDRSTEGIAYPVMVIDGAGEYVAGRNLAESDRASDR